MGQHFQCGDKVLLRTFHNAKEAPKNTDDTENYWKLIGSVGEIMSNERKLHPAFLDMGERVLVEFKDIKRYGLTCHNDPPNSLWIFISDLSDMKDWKDYTG